MDFEPLVTALRNQAAKVRTINVQTGAEFQALRDAADLIRVLANITGGDNVIHAFGPPGDWGYDTEIGAGVLAMREGSCAGKKDETA